MNELIGRACRRDAGPAAGRESGHFPQMQEVLPGSVDARILHCALPSSVIDRRLFMVGVGSGPPDPHTSYEVN